MRALLLIFLLLLSTSHYREDSDIECAPFVEQDTGADPDDDEYDTCDWLRSAV